MCQKPPNVYQKILGNTNMCSKIPNVRSEDSFFYLYAKSHQECTQKYANVNKNSQTCTEISKSRLRLNLNFTLCYEP